MKITDKREYFYQGCVIKLRYATNNYYFDGGWYWEVFRNQERMTDNSKSYPDNSIDSALFYAKQSVDDALDIDSDEMPILVLEY